MKGETTPSSEDSLAGQMSYEEFVNRVLAESQPEQRAREDHQATGQKVNQAIAQSLEQQDSAPEIQAVKEKAKKNPAFKNFLAATIAGSAILTAAGLAFTGLGGNKNKSPQTEPQTIETVNESYNPYAGETPTGTKYDYSHYADIANKETQYSYDYDMSASFNNREDTIDGIMGVASRAPEALASYAYNIFTDDEKQDLGITGMSMTEIDDYMSSETNPDAGAMQQRLTDKLDQVLNSESTKYDFYYENDEEYSNYVYYIDEDNDGVMKPYEMHLNYSARQRDNAPQVDISRRLTDANGETSWVKMLDLNMKCGFQPNYEIDQTPSSVPYSPVEYSPSSPVSSPEWSTVPQQSITPEVVPAITPEPTPEPTPAPTPEPVPTPAPIPEPETIAPKDYENMERIDNQIFEDIAQDIGTTEVKVTPTPEVRQEDITEEPAVEVYEGTAPVIIENQEAQQATPVQEQVTAPENNYSQDLGGANANEYAPVQENVQAQEVADQAEIPIEEAPGVEDIGGAELDDILAELGIE